MSRDYNISWEVTGNCNHNCFYCYNFWRHDGLVYDEFENMQRADYDKLTDKLISMRPVSVAIAGGEPLIVFDKIRNSIVRLTEKGIFVRLLTNGSLVTDEIAQLLSKHRVQVMLSFPSSDEKEFFSITKRNNLKDVLAGLDALKKYNADVVVNVVVSTVNLKSMEATADFLIRKYGYNVLYFSRATRPLNASPDLQKDLLSNEELQDFFDVCLKIKEKYKIEIRSCGGYAFCSVKNKNAFPVFAKGCGGGQSSFVVSNDGSLRVCSKDSQVFGNIFEDDVDEIMERATFWTDDRALPEECKGCRYKKQCRGGCHMSSGEISPRYNSIDFNADPSFVEKFRKKRKRRTVINPVQRYVLNDRTNYCKTDNGNRFSNHFFWVYLSDELTDALKKGKGVSLFTVVSKSGCSFKKSKSLFFEMLKNKIITEK